MSLRLLKNEWVLICLLVTSFYLIDKYAFNYTPTEEELSYKEFLQENVQDSERILKETIQYQKDLQIKLESADTEYQKILNKNKELKALIREHECGKNSILCKKDANGNFMVYEDIVGVKTVGYGNTSFPKNNPHITSISERHAEILFDQDLDKRIAQFKNDDIYLKHKRNLDQHPRTIDMYVDLIYVVGYTAFKYKKNKDGSYSKQYTDTYKEALKDPFSIKAMKLIKSFNKAGGKEIKGLTNRHNKTQQIALLERHDKLESKRKKGSLTVNEYFNMYSGL